jgi:hypothetical protein
LPSSFVPAQVIGAEDQTRKFVDAALELRAILTSIRLRTGSGRGQMHIHTSSPDIIIQIRFSHDDRCPTKTSKNRVIEPVIDLVEPVIDLVEPDRPRRTSHRPRPTGSTSSSGVFQNHRHRDRRCER